MGRIMLVAMLLVLAGCGGTGNPAEPDVSYRLVTGVGYNWQARNATAPGYAVINDTATWRYWISSIAPGSAPPDFDFSKETAVLVVSGQKPDSCYEVTVERVRANGTALAVDATDIHRAPCVCATVLTYPFKIIALAKTSAEITVEWTTATRNCGT